MTFNSTASKEKCSQLFNISKLKEFAMTNTGMALMVVIIFVFLIALHLIHKHSTENEARENFSSWNTSGASSDAASSAAYSYDQPSDSVDSADSADTNSKTSARRNTLQAKQLINTDNPDLQSQINTLKQELDLLVKQVNQLTLSSSRKPYQLLGVRFDDAARQWVADIKLDNKLQSLKAGETFEGWHVVSVDSEGASID